MHPLIIKDDNNKYLTLNINFEIRHSVQMTWTIHYTYCSEIQNTTLDMYTGTDKIFGLIGDKMCWSDKKQPVPLGQMEKTLIPSDVGI